MSRSRALILLASVFLSSAVARAGGPKVVYLVGEATLRRAGASIPVRVPMECRLGDTLLTASASRLELRYPDATVLRLSEKARLVVADRSGRPQPELVSGQAWANVKRVGEGGTGFGVRTPTAVAAVRGTVFRIGESDTATSVRLYEGKVDVGSLAADSLHPLGRREVSGPREIGLADWVALAAGQQILVRRDGSWSLSRFDARADYADPWTKWNAERDSALGRPLPPPDSLGGTENGGDPWRR